MATQFQEGQKLRGSDGNIYVVRGGIPVMEQAGPRPLTIGQPDPYKPRQDARQERDQALQEGRYGISERDEKRSDRKAAIDNPQTLRKEYASLPEVKEYKVAAQMTANGLNTAPNPQGDIALVYSFAKAMDPGSVVRDQEANMVTNSQPWFQSAVQNIKKQFSMDGAGNFTPEARARIRQEIVRALASRKPLYEARRAEMAELAMANGIRPDQIVGKNDTEIYAPSLKAYAEKNGDEGNVISGLLGIEPIAMKSDVPSPEMRAAGFGATESSIPIKPEMQKAYTDYLTANWGALDPQDYAAFRVNLDSKFGFGTNPEGYAEEAKKLNEASARGVAPGGIAIPAVKKDLSGFDQFRNNAISNPVGAGFAGGLNSAALGVPSLFAPEQMQAIREEYPIESFVGDVGGGLLGTGLVGKGLGALAGRSEGTVANILANPLTADLAYGATYGATQAEDPLYGAVGGAASAFAGNRLGRAIGGAFPGATGMGRQINRLDESVPSSQKLRDEASALYADAEINGLTATPDETYALADRVSGILAKEGRLSPKGNLTEVQTKVKEAYKLAQDYAGEPMTPTQIQTVRGVIADGLSSKDDSERRIARLLLNDFDDWTDATNPALAEGLRDARGVASRYLQGDQIAQARELADVRAGQFSNAGQGNALRTDFRQLDRGITKGQESFAPGVERSIREVARGTPMGNALRFVGRFAPTGPLAAVPTMAAIGGAGAAAGPLGAMGGLGLGALAYGARQLGQGITERGAQVAENVAYGGPQYDAVLTALLEDAASRGGHGGAVTTTELARLLADKTGY